MHGLGNDFIILDGYGPQRLDLEDAILPQLARTLCARHFGAGADGVLLVLPSHKAEFRMRLINSDGSEAEHCGNGIRCVARYIHDREYSTSSEMTIETTGRLNRITVQPDGESVTVDFGAPALQRESLPMTGEPGSHAIDEPVEVGGHALRLTAVSMGNPHVVHFVEDLQHFPVGEIGPQVEHHPLFPRRTNVEFVQVNSPSELSMRVWERGAGETMACGTGACASLVAASLTGRTGRRAVVHLAGGDLDIEWEDDGRVLMTGPAVTVYRGDWLLPLPGS